MTDLQDILPAGYNPAQAAEDGQDGDFAPLPAGWYQVRIEKAELKQTNAGTGTMLKLQLKVEGPSHANRVMFDQIVLKRTDAQFDAKGEPLNGAAKNQSIGLATFGQLLVACGYTGAAPAISELVGHTAQVKLSIKQPTTDQIAAGYTEAQNNTQAYKAVGQGAPGSVTTTNSFNDSDIPF